LNSFLSFLSFSGISKNEQARRIANQLEHLQLYFEDILNNDRPHWLLVVGHYPIYSAGDHCDNSELISYLKPLLQQYNAHAFISGHDHISEHLQYEGMDYFVAGAGSMTDSLNSKCSTGANLVWSGTGYSAFAYVDATTTALTMNYVDTNNEIKYSYTLTNPLTPVWTKKPSYSPVVIPATSEPTSIPSEAAAVVFPLPPSPALPTRPVTVIRETVKPTLGEVDHSSSSSDNPTMTSEAVAYLCIGSVAVMGLLIAFGYFRAYEKRSGEEKDEKGKKQPRGTGKNNKNNNILVNKTGNGGTLISKKQKETTNPIAKMASVKFQNISPTDEEDDDIDHEVYKGNNNQKKNNSPKYTKSDEMIVDEENQNHSRRRASTGTTRSNVLYYPITIADMTSSSVATSNSSESGNGSYSYNNSGGGNGAILSMDDSNLRDQVFETVHTPGRRLKYHRRSNTTAL
jgi:hypothetical protein